MTNSRHLWRAITKYVIRMSPVCWWCTFEFVLSALTFLLFSNNCEILKSMQIITRKQIGLNLIEKNCVHLFHINLALLTWILVDNQMAQTQIKFGRTSSCRIRAWESNSCCERTKHYWEVHVTEVSLIERHMAYA